MNGDGTITMKFEGVVHLREPEEAEVHTHDVPSVREHAHEFFPFKFTKKHPHGVRESEPKK